MGEVVPFARAVLEAADGPWTLAERAELAKLAAAVTRDGLFGYEVAHGLADGGEPWFAISMPTSGETVLHVARIRGRFVLHHVADDLAEEGPDLRSMVRRATREGGDGLGGWGPGAAVLLLLTQASFEFQDAHAAAPAAEAQDVEWAPPDATELATPPGMFIVPSQGVAPSPPFEPVEGPAPDKLRTDPVALPEGDARAPRLLVPFAGPATLDPFAGGFASLAATVVPDAPVNPTAQPLRDGGEDIAPTASGVRRVGTAGDDRLEGGRGDDTLLGGDGNDTLTGGDGDDRLDGGGGDDLLLLGAGRDTGIGGEGRDVLIGNDGGDLLRGGSEDDALFGGQGADRIFGGPGSDKLVGGSGDDAINGRTGSDLLSGGAGADLLTGQFGRDILNGDRGDDTLLGGNGRDTLAGRSGNDRLDGGGHADMLEGGAGHDTLLGGSGRDWLQGGDGNDWLDAEAGRGVVRGGDGNDTLVLRPGVTAFGGAGADLFLIAAGYGSNANRAFIVDFNAAEGDLLDLLDGTLPFDWSFVGTTSHFGNSRIDWLRLDGHSVETSASSFPSDEIF